MTDRLESIRAELLTGKEFTLAPATGAVTSISFLAEGDFDAQVSQPFDSWEVAYAGPDVNTPCLMFKADGVLKVALFLENTGIWKGRDRVSKGWCTMTPSRSVNLWKELSDALAWARKQKLIANATNPPDTLKNFTYKDDIAVQFDWAPYEYNLAEMLDVSRLKPSKTAVALIAFDRPTYFERTVESLAKNPEIHSMPCFLFLDKAEQDSGELEKHKQIIARYLPHTVVIKRPRNYGCGRNLIDAREQLFQNMGYDNVFVFEDDMVVSPTYMRTCLDLLEWGTETWDNVGVVQAWSKCIMSLDAKQRRIGEVHSTATNLWGYLMRKTTWDAIREEILAFQTNFLGSTYAGRPHKTIWEYFRLKRSNPPAIVPGNRWFADQESSVNMRRYLEQPPTGQDAATVLFMEQAGLVRLTTSVNRGLYIGKQGIHMHPRMFKRDGYDSITLDTFIEDSNRLEFFPRGAVSWKAEDSDAELPGIKVVDNV